MNEVHFYHRKVNVENLKNIFNKKIISWFAGA